MYKTLVTLDLPLRLLILSVQYTVRRILGQEEKAASFRDRLHATASFVSSGLPDFWRS